MAFRATTEVGLLSVVLNHISLPQGWAQLDTKQPTSLPALIWEYVDVWHPCCVFHICISIAGEPHVVLVAIMPVKHMAITLNGGVFFFFFLFFSTQVVKRVAWLPEKILQLETHSWIACCCSVCMRILNYKVINLSLMLHGRLEQWHEYALGTKQACVCFEENSPVFFQVLFCFIPAS